MAKPRLDTDEGIVAFFVKHTGQPPNAEQIAAVRDLGEAAEDLIAVVGRKEGVRLLRERADRIRNRIN